MGKYVDQTTKGQVGASFEAKCKALLEDGAIIVPKPDKFIPNLVCVIDNGYFGAAGYMYSESEFKKFADPSDTRPKRWFVWDKVEQFAG